MTDPAKAKAIRETALFYVRQRTQDLLTQMAVTVQGYLALDLVKKNNVELVKGVDRASTTTVAALRTAVTVAQALINQKLVLDQITALNTTTANIIDSTGKLLKSRPRKIHEQAASATIPVETLQRAFQNIYDTMDKIDTFKLKALDSMKTTVDTLAQRGREVARLYRACRGRDAEPAGGAIGRERSSWRRSDPAMSDVDDIVFRSQEVLDRTRLSRTSPGAGARRRREAEIKQRVGRIVLADTAIIVAALGDRIVRAAGDVRRAGRDGAADRDDAARSPSCRSTAEPKPETFHAVPLKALPLQTERVARPRSASPCPPPRSALPIRSACDWKRWRRSWPRSTSANRRLPKSASWWASRSPNWSRAGSACPSRCAARGATAASRPTSNWSRGCA